MKKQLLLFLLMMPLLPACLYAQISIGENTYASLQEAIEASADGDVIEIAGPVVLTEQVGFAHEGGTTRTLRGTTPDASISLNYEIRIIFVSGETIIENLTLIGSEEPFGGQGAMMVLETQNPKVVFKNDTIRGGKTLDHGGVFQILEGSTIEAYNTVFRDNEAGKNGGVFFALGGNTNMTLRDCLFLNNKAGVYSSDAKGGVLSWIYSGAEPGTNIAENCAFIGNSSSNHGGVYGSESIPMTFVNCTFSGNSAVDNGGAFWMFNTSGEFTTTLVNCTLYGNTAGNGGALFMNHTTTLYEVLNTVIAENTSAAEIASGETPATITARNSYFPELPEGLTESSGAKNLNTGELHLAELNVEEGVYWHDVTSGESVLVTLGNPGLLKPYSSTDQRGTERNLDATSITAGAIQYVGEIPTAIDLEDIKSRISVYPNPTSDFITIETPRDGEVALYTIDGNLVARKQLAAGKNRIDISGLPQSVYILKNISADEAGYIRFIKR